MSFYSLHSHTYASNIRFLDSINRPKDMIKKAIDLGFGGIAFTDHESLSAAVEIIKERDKIKKDHPDFKIIFGNEIYLIDESEVKNTNKYYHFILLAKDKEGWDQLRELSSFAWENSYVEKGQVRVPTTYQKLEEVINKNPGHIFASTACFTKGHQVQTSDGLKNIENISVGDKVLTHSGKYQKVLSPTSRQYSGQGYNIKFRHNDQDITCTDEHKFLVYHLKVVKKNPCTTKPELIWKKANELRLYDKTLDLMPTYSYSNIQEIDIKHILKKYHDSQKSSSVIKYHLKEVIKITPELMRLYGLWLGDGSVAAEGSKNIYRITISFNEKEFGLFYPIVEKGLQSLGEFIPTIFHKPEQHKVECVIYSAELAFLLRYISEDGKADSKFINSKLKHISKEMDAEILYGYLLADGYFRKRNIKMSGYTSDETVDATVSVNLFDDITELYYSIGFVPRKYTCKERIKDNVHHKKSYYHSVSCGPFSLECNKNRILSHIELIDYLKKRVIEHERGKVITYNDIKYLLKSVKKIKPVNLNETVYCLNVEEDHSFVCNGIVVHNCIGGYLPHTILEHNVPEANNFIRWCIKTFGIDNFALELQPSDNEEQIIVNKALVKLARHYNLPFIVTTDSHYLDKEDFKIHSAFLNSKQTSDRETDKFYRFTYMMTEEEMIDILTLGITKEEALEAISNTSIIGEKIQEYDFRHGTIVPKIKIPEFKLTKELYGDNRYPITNKFYDSDDEQDRYLMYQIEQGIHNKKIVMDDIKKERIEKELDILDYISERLDQKLSAYLNLTVNIINLAWQASLVAPGRGSSTGFYINYLIGITQIDPFVYGLKEWRFLNKERVELPDVDSDFQPEKTAEIIKILREEYGDDHVLNCATFKTESLKSAILSCGRGLGYNNDDMQALAAMVPAHRGHTYTLKECLEGDEEKGFVPVKDFEAKLRVYPGLFEAVQKIEGLPTNASIHASALYVFNDGYLPQNSLMRAPNKTKMTAFSMHDSDDMGALKMDVLRTDAQSKIAKCLELLLKDKQIEWKGSLRKTYDSYLHPDVLVYDNPMMWEKMSDGDIPNLFQMDSPVGAVAMKKARPENVTQLAEVNSIMRLQAESGEQPIDRYVRFRNDINQWYLEMADAGLNQKEIQILEKYLLKSYGVSGSQEILMQLLMEPEISGFTLGAANNARKVIAKKKLDKIAQLKEDFYEKGSKT